MWHGFRKLKGHRMINGKKLKINFKDLTLEVDGTEIGRLNQYQTGMEFVAVFQEFDFLDKDTERFVKSRMEVR